MTRDEIKALAFLLTAISADADTLPRFIDDVFNEQAFSPTPQMLKAEIKKLTSGTATYAFETDMLKLVAAFYDDELLSLTTVDELNSYSTSWPSDSGDPKAITQDELDARNYTVYPNPSSTSDDSIPIHGEPYGEDFASNSLTIIYSDNREASIPEIFALPFILEALAREFSYPSSHADADYAEICRTLSTLFTSLIGVR